LSNAIKIALLAEYMQCGYPIDIVFFFPPRMEIDRLVILLGQGADSNFLSSILVCEVGNLSRNLGLPLSANFKDTMTWNTVEKTG
jgi:hypothetical protein